MSGFTPFGEVEISLYSDPVLLMTLVADANGSSAATVVLPTELTGNHELKVVDMIGPDVAVIAPAVVEMTVGQTLPVTGSSTGQLLWAAALPVLLGSMLIFASSPAFRRPPRHDSANR